MTRVQQAPVVDLTRLKPLDSLFEEARVACSYRRNQFVCRAYLRFAKKMGWDARLQRYRDRHPRVPLRGLRQRHRPPSDSYPWPLMIRTSLIGEDPEIIGLVFQDTSEDLPTLAAVLSWEDCNNAE